MSTHTAAAAPPAIGEVIADLQAEYDRLRQILVGLDSTQWAQESAARGWDIACVVAHLLISTEAVTTTLTTPADTWTARNRSLDEEQDEAARSALDRPARLLERWSDAADQSIRALRAADPSVSVRWAAAPLKPRTLAITRIAEHWAHGLDITEPFGIAFEDQPRLRHVAWLGHATLPYAFGLHGLEPQPVRAVLTGTDGKTVAFGPDDAPTVLRGTVGAFCRVGARLVTAAAVGLVGSGPFAEDALRLLRNYAA